METSPENAFSCGICKENFYETDNSVGTIPCGHCCHIKCLDKWFFMQRTDRKTTHCPICRAPTDGTKIIQLFLYDGISNDAYTAVPVPSMYATDSNENDSDTSSMPPLLSISDENISLEDNLIDSIPWEMSANQVQESGLEESEEAAQEELEDEHESEIGSEIEDELESEVDSEDEISRRAIEVARLNNEIYRQLCTVKRQLEASKREGELLRQELAREMLNRQIDLL